MRWIAALLTVVALSLGAPMLAAAGESGVEVFHVDLAALNDSGVHGHVLLQRRGDTLSVKVVAHGLTPEQMHMQHIHGFTQDGVAVQDATCPTPAADVNGDGLVDLPEGLPFYGPVQRALTPYPMADADGDVVYMATFSGADLASVDLDHLTDYTVVLHGMDVGGAYVASLPVACGPIEASGR